MNCKDGQLFVSMTYDGERVPREAAEHITSCPVCKSLLHEYAQMGAELRLLANADPQLSPRPIAHLPSQRGRWTRTLTARILIPRSALALGILAIAGLSLGLGLMRAQGSGLWFQFAVSTPGAPGNVGVIARAGEPAARGYISGGGKKIGFQIRVLKVQEGSVRLVVRARTFRPAPGSEETKLEKYQAAVVPPKVLNRILGGTPARQFNYAPGRTLNIPVEGGGKIELTGKVLRLRPSLAAFYPVAPRPNQIVLSKAALVRGNEFLGDIHGGGDAEAKNSAVGVCVPRLGAFVFALKPFHGAVAAEADFGQARFEIDGQHYILFSGTAITGGNQPRQIWVYKAPACGQPLPKVPVFLGAGDVSNVLQFVRKWHSPSKD
jgi:hypothetical protein